MAADRWVIRALSDRLSPAAPAAGHYTTDNGRLAFALSEAAPDCGEAWYQPASIDGDGTPGLSASWITRPSIEIWYGLRRTGNSGSASNTLV
jgi:hypothetical protein